MSDPATLLLYVTPFEGGLMTEERPQRPIAYTALDGFRDEGPTRPHAGDRGHDRTTSQVGAAQGNGLLSCCLAVMLTNRHVDT